MPQDNYRYWHDKEGAGGQGFVESDRPWEWRAPDTGQYNAYANQQAATSGQYLDALSRGQDSYGEAMLQKGLGDTSRAMASQAASRGANPSAERAAIMGGANLAAQNNANAAALRAQEMQAARMAHMQNMNQLRGGELGWAQLDAQMQQAAAQNYAQMAQTDIARDAETRQVISTAMGGAGSMLGGMLSDERLKRAVGRVSPAAQDELAQAYEQERQGASQAVISGATMQAPTEWTPGLSAPRDAAERRYEVEQGPRYAVPEQALADQPLPAADLYDMRRERAVERHNSGELYLEDAVRRAEAEAEAERLRRALEAQRPASERELFSDERLKAAVLTASPEAQDEIAARFAAQKQDRAERLHRGLMAVGGIDTATGRAISGLSSAGAYALGNRDLADHMSQNAVRARRHFANHLADRGRAAVGAKPRLRDAQTGYGKGAGRMYDALAEQLELNRFQYTPKAQEMGAPAGERIGVMAQDMERSELGKQAVVETPEGHKAIDRDNALGLSLGMHGRAAERIDQQEARIAQLEAALSARKGDK